MPARTSPLLIDALGALFFAILFFSAWITYRAHRPPPRRPMWKSESSGSPTSSVETLPGATKPTSPAWRAMIAFAGGTLLTVGGLMPSSLLVQSAAVTTPPFGDVVYISFAILAVLLAAARRFRFLYLAGGVPLLLLLTSGVESTIMMEKYSKSAQEYYGQIYGVGLSWIVMLAGAGLLVLSAAMQPAAKEFPQPPPVKTRRDM